MGQVQRKLDLPVASSDMTWDAGAALKRVKAWASTESEESISTSSSGRFFGGIRLKKKT